VHSLLRAAAASTALSKGRHCMAPRRPLRYPGPRLTLDRPTALFQSQLQLRRAWGVNTVREMARHRLARIPLIQFPRGTLLARVWLKLQRQLHLWPCGMSVRCPLATRPARGSICFPRLGVYAP
jgi:hypothetical protein